jgi:tripartite-type tricarboxylate transporter receptor subunit TctC
VLAVTSEDRVEVLPDVQTASEQGVDVDITMWRGLAAPAGTPDDVVMKLQNAAAAAVETAQFKEASKNIGFSVAFMPSAEFGELMARDDAFYKGLLTELGLAK